METLDHYRQIIQQVLKGYAQIPYPYGDIQDLVLADPAGDHYLWLRFGWEKRARVHNCVVHIDIKDGKIWIQRDNTAHGIALDLEAAGIPKSQIVLAFHSPEVRAYTEYAVA